MPSRDRRVDERLERANMRTIIVISTAILVIALHLAVWGSYSLEIRILQARDLVGLASVKSSQRMADICTELKKYNCVEYAYTRMAKIDKTKTYKLAEYQISRRKFVDAAKTLKTHLSTSKKDSTAMLLYARALGELGQIDEAATYYEKTMAMHARVLQPDVVKSYVKDLARAKRYTQAQAVILRARRVNAKASRFMEQEYRLLDATNGRSTASK
jgi:tetratricopeptide (TPR) repeat protein